MDLNKNNDLATLSVPCMRDMGPRRCSRTAVHQAAYTPLHANGYGPHVCYFDQPVMYYEINSTLVIFNID